MKTNYLKLLLLSICTCIVSFPAQSQDPEITVSAQSPNASGFENVETDLFRGSCNINIPLYTLKSQKITVPIKLNYNPPKRQMEEVYHPGWTGLGWNLSAGGVINRVIRGVADEDVRSTDGKFYYPFNRDSIDTDDYFFNFCGNSGSFFYHQGRFIVSSSNVDIQITCNTTPLRTDSSGYQLPSVTGFTLCTPDGFSYVFGHETAGSEAENSTEYSSRPGSQNAISWFLTRIESPEGECVYFDYERGYSIYSLSYNNSTLQTTAYNYWGNVVGSTFKEIPSAEDKQQYGPADASVIQPVYLKSIRGDKLPVTVNFIRSVSNERNYPPSDTRALVRFGIIDTTGFKWYKLDRIELIDKQTNKCFKKYNFTYQDDRDHILLLKSLQETGIKTDNSSLSKPAYTFDYIKPVSMGGILEVMNRMTYPSGGFTTFEYEPNEYWYIRYEPELYSEQHKVSEGVYIVQYRPNNDLLKYSSYSKDYNEGSGYRIRRVSNYPSSADQAWVIDYLYLWEEYMTNLEEAGLDATSGIIACPENKSRHGSFPAFDGHVRFSKNTSYHTPPYPGAPDAQKVGYSSVIVTNKKRANDPIFENGYTHYVFTNYEKDIWGKKHYEACEVGKLSRVTEYSPLMEIIKRTDYDYYEYDSIRSPQRVHRSSVEYIPFMYNSKEYSYALKNSHIYYYGKHKPTRKVEYVRGSATDTLSVTSYKYNYETGNLLEEEMRDGRTGDLYTTQYSYHYNSYSNLGHDNQRIHNKPFEVLEKKNGQITGGYISGESMHATAWGLECPFLTKQYRLDFTDYLDTVSYQPALHSFYLDNIMDPHAALKKVYQYDNEGNIIYAQDAGKEPVIYIRDTYGRVILEVTGTTEYDVWDARRMLGINFEQGNRALNLHIADMQKLRNKLPEAKIASYTYNVHGITSVTDARGITQYTEYDALGYPYRIKDSAGNILKNTEYNYNINP